MFELVMGGAASGKSEYAEGQCMRYGKNRIYIAAMMADDPESLLRIKKHREARKDKGFSTIECYTHLEELDLPEGSSVILECLSNLTANEMFSRKGRADNAEEAIICGIDHLIKTAENLVVVTNNVFEDGLEYDEYTEKYMQVLSDINCRCAQRADRVTEVVCGIPIAIKNSTAKSEEYCKENEV